MARRQLRLMDDLQPPNVMDEDVGSFKEGTIVLSYHHCVERGITSGALLYIAL